MEQILQQILGQLQSVTGELQSFRTEVNERLDRLEQGQTELKESFRHNNTLMIENFTDIRKDLRTKHQDMQADVNLLFKEVEETKRKVNKLEQRIS